MLTRQPYRPMCINCKNALTKPNGTSKHGFQKWHKYCSTCATAIYNQKFGHRLNKKTKCDKCGFVPQDKCQLDIVYKDGDKNNKVKSNIQTLCANCNRLYQKKLREKKKSLLDITIDTDYRL